MTPSSRSPADGSGDGVHVLCVDDDPATLDHAEAFLTRYDGFVVHTETDPEAALASLPSVDCVVSGYDVPGMDGSTSCGRCASATRRSRSSSSLTREVRRSPARRSPRA